MIRVVKIENGLVHIRCGPVRKSFPDSPRHWALFWALVIKTYRELGSGGIPPVEGERRG